MIVYMSSELLWEENIIIGVMPLLAFWTLQELIYVGSDSPGTDSQKMKLGPEIERSIERGGANTDEADFPTSAPPQ